MTYEIVFASTAIRDLERIPPRIVPAVIELAYGDLARNPKRVGKALERELAGLYSARRGPYRILYEIHDEEVRVIVIRVDHRADAYRPR
ncbi:type II toxin-antitoxin system RelE/ParE family toxin [Leifsonia sp. NPDC058194]|uniref:type II toxin-antitoxin system RelE family toxin n=1 Tax=Leifsonia sp. NPDC058194 TaxID=3346374 RepID=UPI0036DEA7AF